MSKIIKIIKNENLNVRYLEIRGDKIRYNKFQKSKIYFLNPYLNLKRYTPT